MYGEADIVVKVQSPVEGEIGLLREGRVSSVSSTDRRSPIS